jgi:hypothetical protein
MATVDGSRQEPKPHNFSTSMVNTDEGMKPLSRCMWCMKTKTRIENQAPKEVVDPKAGE